MRALRAAVSGSRVRYQKDGFDLDLTYITPKLIAMSYPASGVEKTYRNDINEVAKFLNSRHPNVYRVYNLTQRSYDYSRFDGRVNECGFPDHHPPPLQMLIDIVNDVVEWVSRSPKHVIVVHSQTGHGRVGVVCSCYLLLVGYYGDLFRLTKECEVRELANISIRDFWNARGDGVRLPSQALYIYYFIKVIRKLGRVPKQIPPLSPAKKAFLHRIVLNGVNSRMQKCFPLIHVLPAPSRSQDPPLIYNSSWQQPTFKVDMDDPYGRIIFEINAEIQGDILVRCLENSSNGLMGRDKGMAGLFHFTFNTAFFKNEIDLYRVPKLELDEAAQNDRFPSSFSVSCHVNVPDSSDEHCLLKSPDSNSIHGGDTAESCGEDGNQLIFRTPAPSRYAQEAISNHVSGERLPFTTGPTRASAESTEDPVTTFVDLFTMCEQMEETRAMCEDVLERLQRTRLEIDERKTTEPPASFVALQGRFKTFLIKYTHRTAFERLVSTRTVVGLLRGFHEAIDVVEAEVASESVTNQETWMEIWDRERQEVDKRLRRLWEANAVDVLTNLPDRQSQEDALILLSSEMTRNHDSYSAASNKMLESVTQSVARLSGASIPVVPDWFIPNHEVQREQYPFARGSFGMVYRGTWRGQKVVVKCVDVATADDKRTFAREARIWLRAQHSNVVKFYGACHLTHPSFFVCEEATQGNLADFLTLNKHMDRASVWRLLLDAALGLQFLHQSGIVHGDLKCNQILVSEDGVAKLTDFGLSFVSLESRPMATSGAVRWKAPELLTSDGRAPTFASDVYSFGMCVVEAVTRCVPWGIHLPDQSVIYNLLHDTFLSRPKAFEDDEQWELVRALCRFDPSERLRLSAAIEQLEKLADQ